ncbi:MULTISPECIES: hypothetical protein [unclassified Desulfovibrio]|uniref:ADP-ribosyltransferase-containing protein n=1 Tax=unclassified Desulfovibrio TaxID=2593640 RepID=UPI000F5FC7D1|nr:MULTISPECIES: hypothetical protein [unclassified Desulfovibrio]RRD69266.1 hypothetical protein EII24_10835 [Desulfovibrio sp. OH1209_COT-279]RRD85729.1 hypothetical protein EII23_10835 [Desulfovibrio sp. OH1186_COT-070]
MRCSDGRSGARPGHHCPHRGSASEHRSYADSDNDFFTEKILMTHEEFEASQMRNIKEALFQSTSGEYEDMLRRMKEKYGERLYRDMTDEELRDLEAKEAAFFAAKKQAKPQPEPEVEPIYTSEFKGWFGDWEDDAENASKVVDDDGYPLVVYHGTPKAGFEAFDRERLGKSTWHSTAQLGFFFSSERVANGFTGLDKFYDPPEAAGIYPVYLNMRNPYEISAEDFRDTYLMPEGVEDWRDGDDPVIQKNVALLVEKLEKDGHDGIIIRAAEDPEISDTWEELASPNFVVFSPEQIKSVFNRGTWDGSDPRILFQTAHHGSPHKFDKFSLEHIGSGEGAQVHGWGVYVMRDADGISGEARAGYTDRRYRERLVGNEEYSPEIKSVGVLHVDGEVFDVDSIEDDEVREYILNFTEGDYANDFIDWDNQGDIRFGETGLKDIVEEAEWQIEQNNKDIEDYEASGMADEKEELTEENEMLRERIEIAQRIMDRGYMPVEWEEAPAPEGQLFDLEVPDDDVLLDEHLALKDQPEFVREKIREGLQDENSALYGLKVEESSTGRDLYKRLAKKLGSDKEASLYLNSLGIKGIAYVGGVDGPCAVIFDEDAIEILKTYYQTANRGQSQAEAALERDVAAWKKTVDDFLAGTLKPRRSVTILSQTPLVLSLLGANKDLSVSTDYGKLKKILHDKHKLPENVLKQVAGAMADPVMIFESSTVKGDYVMMLDLKDEKGATVVVPISFNYNGIGGYTVNYVPSVYAKSNIQTGRPNNAWFTSQIESGNLRYINNKKSRAWVKSSGLQLPKVGSHPRNGKNKILTETDLVKLREQYPTHYSGAAGTARGGMRKMADGRYVVGLFKRADASTILHETAHFWLEELREAARLEAAPEWVHDAWAKLQAAYGFEGFLDGKNAEGVAAWTGVQERFAREFEAYAREGKAPSWELQSAFNKFRNWLTEIYRTVRKLLGAHGVSEDAREVFDVLLATEEEIALSQRRASENSVMDLLEEEVSPELRDRYARNEASILWARRTSTMLTPEQRKDFEDHKELDAEMSRQYANYPPFAEFKKTERYARACASVRDDLRKEPEPPDNEEIEYHVLRRYMRFGPGSWPFETPNGPELLATDADGTQHWGFR